MTSQEHKVLTANCDSKESIVVSWDYANHNQANGVVRKCAKHSPAIWCLVCMVLNTR